MSVDMDIVGVMAAYLLVVLVDTAQSREVLYRLCSTDTHNASLDCAVHTPITGKYAAITPTMSISTDMIEPLL